MGSNDDDAHTYDDGHTHDKTYQQLWCNEIFLEEDIVDGDVCHSDNSVKWFSELACSDDEEGTCVSALDLFHENELIGFEENAF